MYQQISIHCTKNEREPFGSRPKHRSSSALDVAHAQTARAQVRAQLAALTPQELEESDAALFDRFLALPQVQKADTIFAFWGIAGKEPDTARLIARLTDMGKRVCLPRMLPGHQMEVRLYRPELPLVQAPFGIWEPPEAAPLLERDAIHLALVPAVCYDRAGYRLGFGGGYYDRWLSGFGRFTVGLCRDCVLQTQVPRESHDRRVDLLLTETQRLP